ncbi:hypothetical protein HSBAA_57240 [Vreelandella sulfidaeris]|uniref:SAF domain-containing protein n=1 Tax=Vreelandella sulfidaeris TaxID=115553 RepID=A0A455UJ79_9GAMM|nr:hypothetical protein HSBAA_57240 [Halomonas sulfidaeris]
MNQTIASDSGQLDTLRVHAADNVRVALKDLPAGTLIIDNGQHITLTEAIRHKHKFTLAAFEPGDTVIMYGVTVGRATRPIAQGGRHHYRQYRAQHCQHHTSGETRQLAGA